MPTITVHVSDERHPDHEHAAAYLDDNNFVDWEDLDELYEPVDIEVDIDEYIEWRDS